MYIAELYRNTFKYVFVIFGSVLLFKINESQYLADVFIFGFIVLAFVSTYMVLKAFKEEEPSETNQISHADILKKSYPMSISAMAIFLLMTFDMIFLKKYWGSQTVAYYNVAVKIMTIVAMIINVVNVNLSSKVAEYFYSNNTEELNRILKKSARLIFGLTFPLSILICFNSSLILSFFGQKYMVASNALIVLVLGQGLCAFFGLAPIYLNMTGRQKIFQRILLVAVLVNFLLNRFLIPDYGLMGASIAFSVSMLFWNIIAAFFAHKKDKATIFLT
jgi:O-antigen/teichoic acid export membrane protein